MTDVVELSPELARRLAHELRSPLAVVKGTLERIAQESPTSATSTQLVILARRSCRRLERLSRRLDRIGNGLMAGGVPTPLSAVQMWAERAAGEASRMSVVLSVEAEHPTVLSPLSSVALEVAVDEVVHNAIRHAKTHVDVVAQEIGRRVRVTVRDDGAGIPESQLVDGVVDEGENEHVGGLGIGLVMARAFLGEVGGQLRLHQRVAVIEVPL